MISTKHPQDCRYAADSTIFAGEILAGTNFMEPITNIKIHHRRSTCEPKISGRLPNEVSDYHRSYTSFSVLSLNRDRGEFHDPASMVLELTDTDDPTFNNIARNRESVPVKFLGIESIATNHPLYGSPFALLRVSYEDGFFERNIHRTGVATIHGAYPAP